MSYPKLYWVLSLAKMHLHVQYHDKRKVTILMLLYINNENFKRRDIYIKGMQCTGKRNNFYNEYKQGKQLRSKRHVACDMLSASFSLLWKHISTDTEITGKVYFKFNSEQFNFQKQRLLRTIKLLQRTFLLLYHYFFLLDPFQAT